MTQNNTDTPSEKYMINDFLNSSPVASMGRSKLFSPSNMSAAYHEAAEKFEHPFGRPGTDTSSSDSSTDDEGGDTNPLYRQRSIAVKLEEKKDLDSGSGTPISQSEPAWEDEPEATGPTMTKKKTKTTLAETPPASNPFNAHSPDSKKAISQKQKFRPGTIPKPTPIANPMTMSSVSEAALKEARKQHERLRTEHHPEFTSNLFGANEESAPAKKKKKTHRDVQSNESTNTVDNGEGQKKKRKREQNDKHDGDAANEKIRKKFKKAGKRLPDEETKSILGSSNEKDTGKEHSSRKKTKTKQSQPNEDMEPIVQPDLSSSSGSGSGSSDTDTDSNTDDDNKGSGHNKNKPNTDQALNSSTIKSSTKGGKANGKEATPNDKDSDAKTKTQAEPATSTPLTTQETKLLQIIKTLLPPAQLHAALTTMQQTAKKSHKAKAKLHAPQSTDDTAVILTATRDTLVLLAGKRLAVTSLDSADGGYQNSANGLARAGTKIKTNSIGNGMAGLVSEMMGVGMDGELRRIVAEKKREVEKLQAENTLLRELVGLGGRKKET